MKDYLSVSELSKILGISKSAVYNLLSDEENKSFISVSNGVKKVSVKILDKLNTTARQAEEVTPAPAPTVEKQEDKSPAADELNRLLEENERLKREAEELRKEADELKQEVKKKDSQLVEFAGKFAELAQQAQTLAGQAQVLQLADKKPAAELEAAVVETPQKQGFFKRLFGK